MWLFNSIGAKYFIKRMEEVNFITNHSLAMQHRQLFELLKTARKTEWGKKYDYKSIKKVEEFKSRVPLQDYDSLKPHIQQVMLGKKNVLWPGSTKWFAKSSGTTNDKSKYIPVTEDGLRDNHFKGGRDILSFYCNNNPTTKLFSGKGLVMGGSKQVNKVHKSSYSGDVSAILMKNLPLWSHLIKTPDLDTALLPDWEEKINKMALITSKQKVTNLVGVPTWTVVLINKILEITGKSNLSEVWPQLELYVHGGVSFEPYKKQFKKFIPSEQMHYLQTYNASEGFFAVQDRNNVDDMLLCCYHGVYYEFIKEDKMHLENPPTLQLYETFPGERYALVISTNSGLWRYRIGDVVQIVRSNPYRIKVVGRTKSFINAFGEELMVDNADKAISSACEATNSLVRDYTAAPVYFSDEQKTASHEWLIEFEQKPDDLNKFITVLDEKLKEVNSDYEAKRQRDMALKMPVVKVLADGTFYKWLKSKNKVGGQNKIPRLNNDRKYVDELLKIAESK